jgi:hypothetical protein
MQAHPADATASRAHVAPHRRVHYALGVLAETGLVLTVILAILAGGAGVGAVFGVEMR